MTIFSHLTCLSILDISGNQITNLTGDFLFNEFPHKNSSILGVASLSSLKELYASNNQVREISPLFKLQNLIQLDLSGNRLTEIDFKSASFDQLHTLNLSCNSISLIRNVHTMRYLQDLDLGNFFLLRIPCVSHFILCLASNLLDDFTVTKPLKRLGTLNLNDNKIKHLNCTNLFVLSRLYINENEIRSIEQVHTVDILSIEDQRHEEL